MIVVLLKFSNLNSTINLYLFSSYHIFSKRRLVPIRRRIRQVFKFSSHRIVSIYKLTIGCCCMKYNNGKDNENLNFQAFLKIRHKRHIGWLMCFLLDEVRLTKIKTRWNLKYLLVFVGNKFFGYNEACLSKGNHYKFIF